MLRISFAIALISCCCNFVASISEHPIVWIISYDGFRYDYLDTKGANPVMNEWRKLGTHADFMNNAFMTKTFPNHHTIATGFYPEVHGILGNSVYDPLYQRKLNYSYEFWHYTDDVLPIWIANEKKGGGRHSGIMMWPGNEYNYSGILPTHQRRWQKNVTWEERVDGVIEWILDPKKPANLVILYIEEPDIHGHAYGPESPEHTEELRAMDKITKYLRDRLTATGLINHVNLFFISDHGMQSVTRKDVIDLRKIVPDEKYDRYEGSPVWMIYPKKGEANFVYNALKNASNSGSPFKVYKKNEIPDRWHYKDNRRTPPILAVADMPHVFQDFYDYVKYQEQERNITANDDTPFGVHGWDNTYVQMKPYFFAVGPLIKKGHKVKPFETVDLFSLWAHISGFPELAAKTNGNFDRVKDILVSEGKTTTTNVDYVGGVLGVFLVAGCCAITSYIVYKKQRRISKHFHRRLTEESLESRERLLDNSETDEEDLTKWSSRGNSYLPRH